MRTWFNLDRDVYDVVPIIQWAQKNVGKREDGWRMVAKDPAGLITIYFHNPRHALLFSLQWSSIIVEQGHSQGEGTDVFASVEQHNIKNRTPR